MLHFETISHDTLELLRKIQSIDILKDTRLVGGTALAFFTPTLRHPYEFQQKSTSQKS